MTNRHELGGLDTEGNAGKADGHASMMANADRA